MSQLKTITKRFLTNSNRLSISKTKKCLPTGLQQNLLTKRTSSSRTESRSWSRSSILRAQTSSKFRKSWRRLKKKSKSSLDRSLIKTTSTSENRMKPKNWSMITRNCSSLICFYRSNSTNPLNNLTTLSVSRHNPSRKTCSYRIKLIS